MSLIAWMGAIETGFVYALVALGVFLSFRILDFPDLTVDGSFPLGAAVAATAIVGGWDPFLSTGLAFVAGCIAGSITAWLNVRLKILNLLASILMMIALYSINLRIMGRPNVALLGERTVLTPFEGLGLPFYLLTPLVFAVVMIAAMILLIRFLNSEMGLAMRATGANARMARAQGINTAAMTLLGMALSNGLVAIGGALFAQSQGSADVTMGVGTIVVGLASVIGGEAVMSTRTIARAIIACLVGAILYRVAVALALNAGFLGLTASDLNLVTAVLVAAAMVLPRVLAQRRRKAV
ncbi:ABC transporter permease [Tistrella mobilis]|uniref:ABC transporter permease n=1 Tax=Tistrella mobilis TaxID=171437 RepID=A0A162JM48_9PROT|nr:ABC transporter permease [Tistrella mobilis]KYO49468.1 ABC transporter permease [Tistrella mobilis]